MRCHDFIFGEKKAAQWILLFNVMEIIVLLMMPQLLYLTMTSMVLAVSSMPAVLPPASMNSFLKFQCHYNVFTHQSLF